MLKWTVLLAYRSLRAHWARDDVREQLRFVARLEEDLNAARAGISHCNLSQAYWEKKVREARLELRWPASKLSR